MQTGKLLDFLGSLRLTVVALFFAMALVFLGTLAQVKYGVFIVQKVYFQSVFVFWGPAGAGWKIPVFPGGYLIGGVLMVNLIVAQIRGIQLSRNKIGLYLVHVGLILLLLGQYFTDKLQAESNMRLVEGQAMNYSQSDTRFELAVVDTSGDKTERVIAIPDSRLADGEISHPELPFTIKVQKFYQNSKVTTLAGKAAAAAASEGLGKGIELAPEALVTRMEERNMPSAVVDLVTPKGSLGTWLVSSWLGARQSVTCDGKTWEITMRLRRYYKPYNITLEKFTFERYPGSDIPKNFTSRVVVRRPDTKEERSVLIYMNNPLRYGGEAYYQGSYDPNDERVSILNVVRNPSWLTPYIACLLVGLGLLLHFVVQLAGFVRSQARKEAA
jgi:hypothetical protein